MYKNKWFIVIAGFVAIILVLSWQFKVASLGYCWIKMRGMAAEWQAEGVWLPYYRVTIEAKEIVGIAKNASGLTYNKETGTLFSVINSPPEIVELSTEGYLLRRIQLEGTSDPEGITYVDGSRFVISDERNHKMYWIEIDATTETVDVSGVPRLGLIMDAEKNLGYEGVSWDSVQKRLFIVKEKKPLRVLVVSGLEHLIEVSSTHVLDLLIKEWKPSTAATLFMRDLSSLTFHEATGNLLLLSDESALVAEYGPNREPISVMPMWKGWHGLDATVPQAEGLAVGSDGAIYVLSEPNLFYRFERSPAATWGY